MPHPSFLDHRRPLVLKPFAGARPLAVAALFLIAAAPVMAQGHPSTLGVGRASQAELRAADQLVDAMIRDRTLVVRDVQRDSQLPDRLHERLDQYVRGVRVVGGDLTRQTASDGTISIFGTLHGDVALDMTQRLTSDDARTAIARAAGGEPSGPSPELVVLPLSDGYHLAYMGQAFTGVELMNVYVDAQSGAPLQQYSDFVREIGHGKGTFGDDKKVSARSSSGTFVADDLLRPAAITTYDMKGDFSRTLNVLNRVFSLAPSDIAADSDNDWTDPTVVDGHVYAGWYYDFLSKRFARHGLDSHDLRMAMITHPVRIQDLRTASSSVIGMFYLNAFFCTTCLSDGRGAMVFGEGAPRGTYYAAIDVKPFTAALDVVAHELTHGVTANSARLNGFAFSDAGALNEAFSDMFGVATSFFYQPPGDASLQASYLIGKDLSVPTGAFAIRSISNPNAFGDPDHYSQRFLGADPHYNSTIASHAFYLAIEGGINRTSRAVVQGVGAANRDQIEKAFFRALTVLMPSSSTFGLTRVATIQAARDLYGAGSTVERAITQAWDAVGVQERTVPTATALPNPASTTPIGICSSNPAWILGITVSAGSSNLRITGWSSDDFNAAGASLDHTAYSVPSFGTGFTSCGPGSTTILAQTDACASFCWILNPGVTTGTTQINFTALDDAGRTITFSTPRVTLR
jgi:thermolysin